MLAHGCSKATRRASASPACASAAARRSTAARAPSPHAEGGFATPSGKLELRCDRLAEAGLDPLPFYDPPGEVADEQLAERYPLALLTPKTHLFLNSTFANRRSPARRAARARTSSSIPTTPRRAASPTARLCASATTAAASRAARSSPTTPAPACAVAPMGWWNRDYAGGRSPQATTPQRLTTLRDAPTFNDNRVEIEPV